MRQVKQAFLLIIIGLLLFGCQKSKLEYELIETNYYGDIVVDNDANVLQNRSMHTFVSLSNNRFILFNIGDPSLKLFENGITRNLFAINGKYDYAEEVNCYPNLIFVRNHDSLKIFNRDLKQLSSFSAQRIIPFNTEYFYLSNDGKVGLADTNGKLILPIKYNEILDFSPMNIHYSFEIKYGRVVEKVFEKSIHEDIIAVSDSNGSRLFNLKNNQPISEQYDLIWKYNDTQYLTMANNKLGFISKNGKETVPCKFDVVGEIIVNNKTKFRRLWMANIYMNTAISSLEYNLSKKEYNELMGYGENLIKVKYQGKYGLIDEGGKFIVPAKYQDVKLSINDRIPVKINNKWGIIDRKSNSYLDAKYDAIGDRNSNIAFVNSKNKWNIFEYKSNKVINRNYDSVGEFIFNRAIVKRNEKYLYVDNFGNESKEWFDDIRGFYSNVAIVMRNNKYAIIDSNGKYLTNYIYDFLNGFYNYQEVHEYSNCLINGKYGLIDKSAKYRIIPTKHFCGYEFADGLILAERYVVINSRGKEIVSMRSFADSMGRLGKFYIDSTKDTQHSATFRGVIDKNGRELIPVKYVKISSSKNFIVGASYGYFDIYDRKTYKHIKRMEFIGEGNLKEVKM